MGADGDVYAVELLLDLGEADVPADLDVRVSLDPGGEDDADVLVQELLGQAVAGDAVAQHAAEFLPPLVHGDGMPHEGKEVGRREAGGAAADDGDLAARGRQAGRRLHMAGPLHRDALESADVHGGVHDVAAAVALTGMLADEAADAGEGIVLPDEAHGVGVASLADEGYVARDVHMRRAEGYARDRREARHAAPGMEMGFEIVPEALQGIQHGAGRLPSDGAVRGIHDGVGRLLKNHQVLGRALALEDLLHQGGKLRQSDAAGGALAAALREAQAQEGVRQLHGTVALRRDLDAALKVLVEIIHDRLGFLRGIDTQSTQTALTLQFY